MLKKLKKGLKKAAKAAIPVGAAILAAKAMGGRKKPLVPKYFGMNSGTTGDANIAENIAGWNRGMDKIAARGSVDDKNDYYKKGGLVKKGKPKLAKRGWK